MEKDLAGEEFEGFMRRLEGRIGEEKERSDGVMEGELLSENDESKFEAPVCSSQTKEEVLCLMKRLGLMESLYFSLQSIRESVWRATTSTEPGTESPY